MHWLGLIATAAVLAPGYSQLEFPAPAPGSYELPVLWNAADGAVRTSESDAIRLHDLMGDKVVIMSFIYTSCSDVNGCPLATFVLSQLQEPVAADPDLRDRVRLVTISFDPEHDTPAVMAKYGQSFQDAAFDWRFLTTDSQQELAPLLRDYDQFVQPAGDGSRHVLAHVLRVFLIDEQMQIRNVYNTGFLHPETVMSDLRTVLDTASESP